MLAYLPAAAQTAPGLKIGVIGDMSSTYADVAGKDNVTTAFYWDLNDKTRAWSTRFFDRMGRMPTMLQAGAYSQALAYLRAVQAAGTKDAAAVTRQMRQMPVNDMFATGGKVLANGRMVHDMYLMQVKSPAESKSDWDVFKLLETIPGNRAFRSLESSGCMPVAL